LNTQIEHLDNHSARLTVEVPPERVEKAMQAAARRIANQVNIPGFRKGKAPYKIILQRFGPEAVLNEAVEDLGNDVYREALDESKLEPYAPGSLENIETDPTMRLIFVVPKRPEVELGSYRDIRAPYEAPEVTDEEVKKALDSLLERRAVVEAVDRAAKVGDVVKVKVFATITHPESEDEHAEEDHAHSHTDTWMDEEIESVLTDDDEKEELMPGFSQNLVGTKAGDEREFTLSFDKDHKEKNLAAHTFDFKVTVNEVKSRTLPALNDEFAKLASDDKFETLLDLRMDIRKQLQENATREAESTYGDQALDKIVEQATIKYPDEMVHEYTDEILNTLDRNLRQRGLSIDDYKKIENKTDEQLHEDYRDTAIKRLQRSLVLGEIVNKEKLQVTDADVTEQIDKMSAQFGEQAPIFRSMLMQGENLRGITLDLMTQKALQRVIAIARGENPEIGNAVSTDSVADSTDKASESAPKGKRKSAKAEGSTEATSDESESAKAPKKRAAKKKADEPAPESTTESE
jgi:trigger factor